MANRRMFSKEVLFSDWFTDMPTSAKLLYIYISMEADDEGFITSVKSALMMAGASKDDLNILMAKNYIIKKRDGLYLIKHWKMNNYIQRDRFIQSNYHNELEDVFIKEDGSYTLTSEGNTPALEFVKKAKGKPMSEARTKRVEARKESELPYSFDYKIRHEFHHEHCPICGVEMDINSAVTSPTIQHNVPISLGGKHEIDNISVICRSCNSSIQNREITPPYNTEKVKEIWECIGNGYTGKDSIGKDSIGKVSIVKESKEELREDNKKEEINNNKDWLALADEYAEKKESGEYQGTLKEYIKENS